MSDIEISYKQPMSRAEASRYLSSLAAALGDDGEAELDLGGTQMTVQVPGEVRCEIEVEVDGDEIELEVELTWSTAAPAQPAAASTSSKNSG